jgi:UDP-3-O-[3-hydroxymyristoyl] glucosamine N-acyltransferase
MWVSISHYTESMHTTATLAEALGATCVAPPATIRRVASLNNATPDALIFIESESQLPEAIASGAAAILVPIGIALGDSETPLLPVRHPKLAFARAAKILASTPEPDMHPSAVIGNATIGKGTSVAAGCVLADNVSIGGDCILHPRVTIYPGVTLGDRVIVHAGAVLGADGFGYVRDPATGGYTQFPQQGTLIIEDDVEIGANTTIDRGALEETRIGKGTKIDNLVHIGHNCRIGRNVVIAAQTGISGSTVIGDDAVIGGQVGMGDHATVGPGVVIGSGAGILPHKKLHGPGLVFWGVPAKPLKQYLKELATLARLARNTKD